MQLADLPSTAPPARRLLLLALLGALGLLCIVVLRPFIVPAVWSALLAYTSWPVFRHVRRLSGGRATPAALAMTAVVALVLIVPLAAFAYLLQEEVAALYQAAVSYRPQDTALPAMLNGVPWLGEAIRQALDRYAGDPLVIRQLLLDWAQDSRTELLSVVGSVGRNAAKLFIAILTTYFLYRDGPTLAGQAQRILARFFSDRLDRYLHAAGVMARAVVFGLLVTALLQGTIAGIGYAVVGVDAPVLLGALTALASIVPIVGTALVWAPAAVALLLSGHVWSGLALLAWGTVLVHPVDNLIRPLIISNATQMPFLMVMFGVIGGLAAFGLVGLFVGPVVLAIATAVWREWLEECRDGQTPPAAARDDAAPRA